MNSGKIIAISVSKRKGIQKTNVESALFIKNHGIDGDAHAGDWHRQVSFLSIESIGKMRDTGLINVEPGDFAENITTESIDLLKLKIGDRIKSGDVIFEITQIGKECHSHCAIYHAVGDCVMPREGLFARVISGGEIAVGDSIEVLAEVIYA